MELKINEKFKSIFPKLNSESYLLLEKDILKNGVTSPIITWNGYIVDGHNRYMICKTNGITEFPTKELRFTDEDEVELWILDNQLARRNLTDFERNEIAIRKESIIAEQAKKRKLDNLKQNNQSPKSSKEDNGKNDRSGRTGAILGKIAGTSESSIYRTKKILEKGTPEEIERARKI